LFLQIVSHGSMTICDCVCVTQKWNRHQTEVCCRCLQSTVHSHCHYFFFFISVFLCGILMLTLVFVLVLGCVQVAFQLDYSSFVIKVEGNVWYIQEWDQWEWITGYAFRPHKNKSFWIYRTFFVIDDFFYLFNNEIQSLFNGCVFEIILYLLKNYHFIYTIFFIMFCNLTSNYLYFTLLVN